MDALIAKGDRHLAEQLLDVRGGHGFVFGPNSRAKPAWIVTNATHPWLEGKPLFSRRALEVHGTSTSKSHVCADRPRSTVSPIHPHSLIILCPRCISFARSPAPCLASTSTWTYWMPITSMQQDCGIFSTVDPLRLVCRHHAYFT